MAADSDDANKCQLGASFFCSRDATDRSDITLIFPTLAFQLCEKFPDFRVKLSSVMQKRRDLGYALPSTQFEKLIVEPLRDAEVHMQSILIVIEALERRKYHPQL